MTFNKQLCQMQVNETSIHYHHYQQNANNEKKILFLHGSRLGGEETWHPIITRLKNWAQIIVPELRGTGSLSPICKVIDEFTVEDILHDIFVILNQHHWHNFYLIGYSFGGYIAMLIKQQLKQRITKQLLIESALLADTDNGIEILANKLDSIIELMHTSPEKGNELFTELVEPQRRHFPITETQTTCGKRTIHNPLGFATLMKILATAYRQTNRWQLLAEQDNTVSLLSEYSPEGTHQMAEMIKKRYSDWHIEFIPNNGHGMLFSQPWIASSLIEKFVA